MRNLLFYLLLIPLCGCMDYGPTPPQDIEISNGVFITNEGNFMYGNASLSYYNPDTKIVENEIFHKANGVKLGDVAQSIAIKDNLAYIVVNNSGVIFVIDTETCKIKATITGLVSPRYIHFINEEKAYITDLHSFSIAILNPKTFKITGYIDVKNHTSNQHPTEQMVQYKNLVFTNCWSYDNKILVIDSDKDTVIDSIEVGLQPTSIVLDKYNKLWTVTDGGYEGSPYGYEAPSLYCIDAESRKIERQFKFKKGDWPSEVVLNGNRDTLYFINKAIWRLGVQDKHFPIRPFIPYNKTLFYGLTIDPIRGDVYVADAIDYVQRGIIYRYSQGGKLIDQFKVGIIPGAFGFN